MYYSLSVNEEMRMICSEKVQTLDLHGVSLPPRIRKIDRVLKPNLELSTHKNN